MDNAHWQPTLLIRTTVVLHVLLLAVVIAEPGYWRWALGAVLANHAVLTVAGLWPRSHWLGPNWTRLPAVAAAGNEIAVTFDDGPDPLVTPQVLDLLDSFAVKATFFCIGVKAARYPDLCREIVRRGHAVENHSQRHRGVRPGAILILHDGNAARSADGIPVVLEVLPAILSSAAAAKLRLVTLRQAASSGPMSPFQHPVGNKS
jgi:hypothetical protein